MLANAPDQIRILIKSLSAECTKKVYFEYQIKYFLGLDLSAAWHLLRAVQGSAFWLVFCVVGAGLENDPLGAWDGDSLSFRDGKFKSRFDEVPRLTNAQIAAIKADSSRSLPKKHVKVLPPGFLAQIYSYIRQKRADTLAKIDTRNEKREAMADAVVEKLLKDRGVPFKGVCFINFPHCFCDYS